MTKLLISVRDSEEAQLAMQGGADIIDIKEPNRGSLGASSLSDIRAVMQAVANQRPVSVACGELTDFDIEFLSGLPASTAFVKFGLAGCRSADGWRTRWSEAFSYLPENTSRVAVAYADWHSCDAPEPEAIIQCAAEMQCRYFLIDTHAKVSGLLDLVQFQTVAAWVSRAKAANLKVVIAGSLGPRDFRRIVAGFEPYAVAVRGAACAGQREGRICVSKIERLKATLHIADQSR